MRLFRSDSALFTLINGGHLQGMSGTYVDDMLHADNAKFKGITNASSCRFKMGENDCFPFKFTWYHV